MRRVFLLGFLTLTSCMTYDEPLETSRPALQIAAEIEFAKQTLNTLQAQSIEKNREYCGYIGLNPAGDFIATTPRKGRKESCAPDVPDDDLRVLASYHTHGAYSDKFDSEIPSYNDLESDIKDGVDGYLSTPGGRFWFSNAQTKRVEIICGEGCLHKDLNYQVENELNIQKSYTLTELAEF